MKTLRIIGGKIFGVLLWLPLIVTLPIGLIRTSPTLPRYFKASWM